MSTRPDPTSTNAVAPSRTMRWTHSAHLTGLATCRTRKGTTSAAAVVSPASTFLTTGIFGAPTRTERSSSASRSAAGRISAQ